MTECLIEINDGRDSFFIDQNEQHVLIIDGKNVTVTHGRWYISSVYITCEQDQKRTTILKGQTKTTEFGQFTLTATHS